MQRNKKLFVAKSIVLLTVVPILIWAHEYGPDIGYSNVPGENGTCAQSGCHLGTANDSANRGSVSVAFPNGATYVPGAKQHLVVTISDPAATQIAWGFQLAARKSTDSTAQAGAFQSTDPNTLVMCGSADLFQEQESDFVGGQAQSCPANMPLQYIEHSLTGYQSTRGASGSQTYGFDWTPPASDIGNITLYVAGNAANGDLDTTGDHIYSASFTVTPASAGPPPVVPTGGAVNAAGGQPSIVPGSYIAIYGTNLSPTTDDWSHSITGSNLPTALAGVSVTMGGKPAYVYFVSSGQLDVIAPDLPQGPAQLQVSTANGASAPISIDVQPYGPAFFLWGNFAVAQHVDYSLAVKAGIFGANTPAKPGEVIILWATGFGPTNPAVPAGIIPPPTAPPVAAPPGSSVAITVGGLSADLIYAVLSQYPGLYQIAIRTPATAPDGDLPIKVTIGAYQSPDNVFLTVQR